MLIGHKTKKKDLKPTQPQYVVQRAPGVNEFAKISGIVVDWIGDPRAATPFDSKFAAKARTRDILAVPESRVFMELS